MPRINKTLLLSPKVLQLFDLTQKFGDCISTVKSLCVTYCFLYVTQQTGRSDLLKSTQLDK